LKEGYDSKPTVIGFHNMYNKSPVPFLFSEFVQSGIYHQRQMLSLVREQLKRKSLTTEILKRTHKKEFLDMNFSIQTVFIVYGAMICLAYLGFAAEKCYLILKYLYTKANLVRYPFKIWSRVWFPSLVQMA